MATSADTAGQTPDIYGQVHPLETDELISKSLKEFQVELDKISDKDRKCLRQAEKRCPELLTDAFKLQFLRCEIYNVDLAAKRYAYYWEKRVEVFGAEKAFQPLTLDGALSEDKVALEIGLIAVLPGTDGTGRTVLYGDPSRQDKTKYTRESMLRSLWYYLHAAIEGDKAQQFGIVMIAHPQHAALHQVDRKLMKANSEYMRHCLPIRISAIHICHPPVFFEIVFPIFKIFLGERLRKRIRIHAGKNEKIVQTLSDKFELPKSVLPTELGGDVQLNRDAWLQERRAAGK